MLRQTRDPAPSTERVLPRRMRRRTELPLQGSNLDSPDPESGVLPITPRGSGPGGSRTHDLCSAIAALSQLSYRPPIDRLRDDDARGGSRTHTGIIPRVFETRASAHFATRALREVNALGRTRTSTRLHRTVQDTGPSMTRAWTADPVLPLFVSVSSKRPVFRFPAPGHSRVQRDPQPAWTRQGLNLRPPACRAGALPG